MTADRLDLDAVELLTDSLVVSGGHPVLASNAEGVRRLVAEVRRLREGIRQHQQYHQVHDLIGHGDDKRLWALLGDDDA